MPDKHEVGGSSPLGPTKEKQCFSTHWIVKSTEVTCVLSSNEVRDKLHIVGWGACDDANEMFIENRIKKRNETDSCNWEKLVIENYKGFSVQKKWEQFRRLQEESWGGQNKRKNERLRSFYFLQPKIQLFAKLKQKKLNLFQISVRQNGEKQNGCSSEKERKVNALALRADEGRDNLR